MKIRNCFHRIFAPLAFAALCVSATGCFPLHIASRAGFSGTVVDAETHAPLSDAHITFGTNETVLATSAADGSFAVTPKKRWVLYFIGEDFFDIRWIGGPAYIEHTGYETSQAETFTADSQHFRAISQLGTIPLKPLSQTH